MMLSSGIFNLTCIFMKRVSVYLEFYIEFYESLTIELS
jgi:hypothetical protein